MQRKSILLGVVAILVLVGLGCSAWHFVKERSAQSCKACMRPVHSHMKTVAIVDGKRAIYCCPAWCAVRASAVRSDSASGRIDGLSQQYPAAA